MVNHPNRRRKTPLMAKVTRRKAVSAGLDKAFKSAHDYSQLLESVRLAFTSIAVDQPLFRTDADHLMSVYLDAMPAERQVHTCSACARFLRMYGGLVTVDERGVQWPLFWNLACVGGFYTPVIAALREKITRAKIKSQFFSSESIWGTPGPDAKGWTHMAVKPAREQLYSKMDKTPGQAMAASRENYRTVMMALADFKAPLLDEAIRVLKADALSRSERFINPLQWLRDLQDRPKGKEGNNLVWRAIATAPEGFCHPRASMTGSLLEDIAKGMDFDTVKKRWETKMHPLQYQRPQAAPTAGNIKAAEELVSKLGLARSLERRYARFDELIKAWEPCLGLASLEKLTKGQGVFGHLKAKGEDNRLEVTTPPMTWRKFAEQVLPDVKLLQLYTPLRGNYLGFTTATHADAPPILKWDFEENRYPVAWYVYHNGSPAHQWGLATHTYVNVLGIVPNPEIWMKPTEHLTDSSVTFVLEGARDTVNSGLALFPECLKSELHGIRATVEAYSKAGKLSGKEDAAAGYVINKSAAQCKLRAFVNGGWSVYQIDRWD